MSTQTAIIIYTDGACIGNPGPGGYGVIVEQAGKRREYASGFAKTTNNRMEILAAVIGLEALATDAKVTLYSDSKYLVNAVNKDWLARWQANRWMRNKREKAVNIDLWKRLLKQLARHQVTFRWVKGHAGHAANERCDWLANQAAHGKSLPPDTGYGAESKQPSLF